MPAAPAPSLTARWFPLRKPEPNARLRLLCFPYAGGAASAFNGWSASLPAGVELCAVQTPGRERRLAERPFSEMGPLMEALEPAVAPLLDKPFVLLGYSLGARMAFELARRLQARGGPLPRGLVAAATETPRLRSERHAPKDDAAFIEKLRSYGGTPAEVLAHRELMELLLPTLKADFSLVESPYTPGEPLRCPLAAWGGAEDETVSRHGVELWREEAGSDFQLRFFPGGHFFLRTAREELLAALRELLLQWAPELKA